MTVERRIAHLSFIQGVVNRMGTNSFLLKGWSVTLVAAIFVLSAKDSDHKFVLLAYFPIFMFWVLDAYFLHQEKLFRKLYAAVASNKVHSDEFTLDTMIVKDDVPNMSCVFFSKTLVFFHGSIVAIVIYAMFNLM